MLGYDQGDDIKRISTKGNLHWRSKGSGPRISSSCTVPRPGTLLEGIDSRRSFARACIMDFFTKVTSANHERLDVARTSTIHVQKPQSSLVTGYSGVDQGGR